MGPPTASPVPLVGSDEVPVYCNLYGEHGIVDWLGSICKMRTRII